MLFASLAWKAIPGLDIQRRSPQLQRGSWGGKKGYDQKQSSHAMLGYTTRAFERDFGEIGRYGIFHATLTPSRQALRGQNNFHNGILVYLKYPEPKIVDGEP